MPEARAEDPLDLVAWSRRPVTLQGESDCVVYSHDGVEAPTAWSDQAVAVVASRYLGDEATASIKELIRRVAGTLGRWVDEHGLGEWFDGNALTDLLVRQRGAFNSPVWFNVGREDPPQCSACFILSVEDSIDSILELARIEGRIFKRGSGAGTNLSTIRSRRERIRGGGTASGPLSFMRGYDAFAGVLKSGGRTRRAAKMQILDDDHPDVLEFARAKAAEEEKARVLRAAGYSGGLEGEAYRSVAFQNANLSVRVHDALLKRVADGGTWTTHAVRTGAAMDTLPARDLVRAIAEGAWACGDPGMLFASAIDAWHTCPAAGPIRASNPCGEFLFLDDTACNLASLNLLAYLDPKRGFRVSAFRRDIGILIRTMEAIVDRAGYPTERIAERSRRFRPLGLGYTNLGGLLLALGIPYDSEAGRAWAAALTALLTGEAYRVSAGLAARIGPFAAYAENRAACLSVLERHRDACAALSAPPGPILEAAVAAWDEALGLARRHGVRHAQATALAPTGTISFLLDAATTGIEPEFALVKRRRLLGGGLLRIVNSVVPRALQSLGYDPALRARIVAHLESEETIEGATGLRPEHLEVFDCALPPRPGGRRIAPEGHLAMLAAVQPFVSGGISKTLNVPSATTVEEIEALFLRAWRLGLKSLAVYREGSKGGEPLGGAPCIEEGRDSCCS